MRRLKPPLRDSQDLPPAAFCGRCAGEVWPGETLYRWQGARICPDCFRQLLLSRLEGQPRQLADALHIPYERVL